MALPKTVKEIQKLTGRIAAINRFVSRAMDKCLSFFKTLKQAFVWTDECEVAFQELKRYLSNPPLLSPSKEGESLQLYLAMSAMAVSAALIQEEDKKQLPVYYVSQAFQGAEFGYPKIEKIVRLDRGLTQVKVVFPGKSHPGNDGPTHQKIHEQTQSNRKNGSMGHRTQPVRHPIPP